MVAFITFDEYSNKYFGNTIPEPQFPKYALKSSMEIRKTSSGRIQSLIPEYAEDIQITACQVADIMYENDSMNRNIKSETNDGDSVTYNHARDFDKEIYNCIVKNLWRSGLLYRG